MRILGVETSCDETAVAVVEDGKRELAYVVATSKDFHLATGGIVPEVAARKQLDFMLPVLEQLNSQVDIRTVDAIAVTQGPGLAGSLIVGIETAKSLAFALDLPLVPVNHLVAHFYANFLTYEIIPEKHFPALVLVVSGGHTDLVLLKDHGDLIHLGSTLDDAAGEAFDKTARLLGLAPYLGGVELSKRASLCGVNRLKNKLPRPLMNQDNLDFSFSGLKTAAKRIIQMGEFTVEEVARDFEDAVVDVLVSKTLKAQAQTQAKSLLLGGGVTANRTLRMRLTAEFDALGVPIFFPELRLCGDNASNVATSAYYNYYPKPPATVNPDPSMSIVY